MKYVIVGGGIAGVSCANEILGLERCPKLEVVLVSGSSSVKSVENYRKIGQYGEKFDVKEADSSEIFPDKRFKFLHATVTNWDAQKKQITLQNGETLKYDKLCIATGSRPKLQDELGSDSRFLFLRDTQSARELQNQLGNAKHLLIVGNGGIATELIYELKNVFVTWLVRDAWICASFFPDDVEKFVENRLLTGRSGGKKHDGVQKHLQYSTSSVNAEKSSEKLQGPALGPDWCSGIDFGVEAFGNSGKRSVKILRNSVIGNIETSEELVVEYLDRSTGVKNSLKPDLIIWAGGVVANSEVWREERSLETAHNGGIAVNDACETSIPDVYGCGDVSMLTLPESSLWKQRQLWTQARQLGEVCGRAMAAGAEEARMQNMYFELFSHCTTFFGLKVVFLGDYKPERQQAGAWKVVLRGTEEDKLVRCVVVNNVIVGALLIGETEMEETLENLILNKTDLEGIADTFLEPGVDLDDYFD